MTNEIKVGDKVRVREDAPRLYTDGWSCNWLDCDVYVTKIDGDAAEVKKICDDDEWYYLNIPTKYLIKVEDGAKEPKFKKGDRVVRKNTSTVRTIISIDYVDDDGEPLYHYLTVDSHGNNPLDFLESELSPYTEPTEQKKNDDAAFSIFRDGNIVDLKKEAEEWANEVSDAIKEYGDAMRKIYAEAQPEACWDSYTAELAKEIAPKVVNKYKFPEEVANFTVKVAKLVVEGLKKK